MAFFPPLSISVCSHPVSLCPWDCLFVCHKFSSHSKYPCMEHTSWVEGSTYATVLNKVEVIGITDGLSLTKPFIVYCNIAPLAIFMVNVLQNGPSAFLPFTPSVLFWSIPFLLVCRSPIFYYYKVNAVFIWLLSLPHNWLLHATFPRTHKSHCTVFSHARTLSLSTLLSLVRPVYLVVDIILIVSGALFFVDFHPLLSFAPSRDDHRGVMEFELAMQLSSHIFLSEWRKKSGD